MVSHEQSASKQIFVPPLTDVRLLSVLVQRGVDGRVADENGTAIPLDGIGDVAWLDGSPKNSRREQEPACDDGRHSHGGRVVDDRLVEAADRGRLDRLDKDERKAGSGV